MLTVLAAGAVGVRALAVPNYTKKADGVAEAAKLEPAVALYANNAGFACFQRGLYAHSAQWLP